MAEIVKMWLSEGAGGGGGSAPAASGSAAPAGVKAGDAAPVYERANRRPKEPKHEFVIQKDAAQAPVSVKDGQTSPASSKPTFEDLVKGEYKDDAGKYIGSIVQDRIKNIKMAEAERDQLKAEREKLAPALEALLKKHGLPEGDIDGLVKKITDDDSLYEDEALQKGVPVETLKQMKALERDKKMLESIQAQRMHEQSLQAHFQKLSQQAEEMKAVYPGFDLQSELKNPDFLRLTSPQVGVDVRRAYEVIHKDEILSGGMQYAVQKTAEKLSNAMATGGKRPPENGLNPSSNAVVLTDDAKSWSPEHRREIYKRVKAGEKFVF